MQRSAEERQAVERGLRVAIAKNELELYYQPIRRLLTDTITGFECLIRWRHPTRGLLPPAQFLGVADDIGLDRGSVSAGDEVAVRHYRERQPIAAADRIRRRCAPNGTGPAIDGATGTPARSRDHGDELAAKRSVDARSAQDAEGTRRFDRTRRFRDRLLVAELSCRLSARPQIVSSSASSDARSKAISSCAPLLSSPRTSIAASSLKGSKRSSKFNGCAACMSPTGRDFCSACRSRSMRRRSFSQQAKVRLLPKALKLRRRSHQPTAFGTNFKATPFMQYRRPVGFGPSSKTWPR
jgi:EAL domain